MTLRLLWLIDSLTMGGAESLVIAFAHEARKRDIDLTICARTDIDGNLLEPDVRRAGARVESLGARNLRDVRAFRRLTRLARQADIIHAHLTYSAIWGAVASKITRVPMIATLHVPPSPGGWKEATRQKILVLLLNRYARRVVLVSHALREAWGTRLERAVVVHNGVSDPAAPHPNLLPTGKKALDGEQAGEIPPPIVLSIAVLREHKGLETLIEAARELPQVQFRIAGDGPLRSKLERQAEGAGNVLFLGLRRDVGALLAGSTLFVHPTLADAFPTVILEAMAAGVPVIASDVGGVPEILDEHTGRLVPPGDAHALARAIVDGLADEDWRSRTASAARARYQSAFTIERWADRLEKLYSEVRG